MSNDDAKKMAKLLQQGATMLDSYCPKCGKILFKLSTGKIFCPICEREIKYVQKDTEQSISPQNSTSSSITHKKRSNTQQKESNQDLTYSDINNRISLEISRLIQKLEFIEDIHLYRKTLESLDLLIDIIIKIRNISQ